MARKKGEEEQCGNWMDTYGDMVTLLLTFFVMLFSMSSVNEEKFALLVQAFTSANPDSVNIILDQSGDVESLDYPANRASEELQDLSLSELQEKVPDDFNELYEYLKLYIEKSGMGGKVEVSKVGNGCVFIRFADNIFFNPDSAAIKEQSRPLLDFLGNCLKGVENQIMTININGHTADPKIDNYRISDWRLSSDRASSVAIYFEEQKDIKPQLLLPIGYGKNFPVESNDTPEGREKNRRVDMAIISVDSDLSDQEILNSILLGTFDPKQYPESGGVKEVLIPSFTENSDSTGTAVEEPTAELPDAEPAPEAETNSAEGTQEPVTILQPSVSPDDSTTPAQREDS